MRTETATRMENPTRAVEPFTVMAKPVGPRCNLACSYCYYLETEEMYKARDADRTMDADTVQQVHQGETVHGGRPPAKMSDGLLETYIRQYIEASPGPVVSFTWHGGEPTLAGLDFYRKAVEFQRRYLPPGWRCWNNLQTNGILLDDEWCSFLADAHFDVGLSIDGDPRTHDTYRKDHGGRGTWERVVAACRRLQAHGIQPDLLCTVTSTTAEDPLAVYRALRDLETGWMQFIPIVRWNLGGMVKPGAAAHSPVTPDSVTPDSVTPEGYGDFLCAVFDEWIRHDIGRLEIQQVAEMALVWSGGTANLCWMAPTCGRVLIVEHDGAIYSCDHFVAPEHRIGYIGDRGDLGDPADPDYTGDPGDPADPDYTGDPGDPADPDYTGDPGDPGGSIASSSSRVATSSLGTLPTSTLGALVDSPAQRRFGNAKRDSLPQQCRVCAWLAVCNGGCPKDRFARAENGQDAETAKNREDGEPLWNTRGSRDTWGVRDTGGARDTERVRDTEREEPPLNYLCAGLRRFFAHAEQPLRRVVELRRQGRTPAAIMATIAGEQRTESQARWRGVGRNDPCPCGSGRKAKNCCWDKRP